MTRLWPTQPLLDLPDVTARKIRRAIGLPRLPDTLTDTQADRAAIRLGHMPHVVWPDWTDAALGPLDRHYLAGGWRQAWLWQHAS